VLAKLPKKNQSGKITGEIKNKKKGAVSAPFFLFGDGYAACMVIPTYHSTFHLNILDLIRGLRREDPRQA
jgi:hypothetical protein